MTTTRRSDHRKAKGLIEGLRKAIDALPTEAEKSELQAQCAALIAFFSDLQESLGALPSAEMTENARRALDKLEQALASAETSPVIAAALGYGRRAPQRKKPTPTDEDMARAKLALAEFESLSVDEIRSRLDDRDRYPVRQLLAIASSLSIRATSRLSRAALAQQIVTTIANYRGYQTLRG
jgi:DNA primase